MFKILGSDGKEYGPIDSNTVREWIRERRANGQTRVQPAGSAEWIELSTLPEFATSLASASAPPPLPPRVETASPAAGNSANAAKTSGMAIASLVLGLVGFCGVTAIMGMILGLVSIIKIGKSNGQLKGKGLAIAGMIVSSVMFIVFLGAAAGVLLPALSKAKYQRQYQRQYDRPQYSDCGGNVKKIALAIRLYADEHEGKCPPAAQWCDDVLPNLEGKHIFQCPQRRGGEGAYGFNAKLAGRTLSAIPPDTVMIFETDKGWNTTGGADAVITQPPHGRKFTFGLADGSIREVTKEELSELRWEP